MPETPIFSILSKFYNFVRILEMGPHFLPPSLLFSAAVCSIHLKAKGMGTSLMWEEVGRDQLPSCFVPYLLQSGCPLGDFHTILFWLKGYHFVRILFWVV